MSLRSVREAKAMNVAELSRKSGVHAVKIHQYETGTLQPGNMTLTNATRLANALDCDPRRFLEE